MARIDNLTNFLTDVATSIKAKTGDSSLIPASQFDTKIAGIQKGKLSNEEYTKANNNLDEILYQSENVLPDTYQEVEYLEASGTQYIDTNFTPNINTKAYAEFYVNTTPCGLYSSDSGASLSTNFSSYISGSGKWRFGSGVATVPISNNSFCTSLQDKTGIMINGTTLYDYDTTINDFTSTKTLTLLRTNTVGFKGKIYKFKLYDGNNIVRNFVPCYRKSDNEAGMYDTVNNVFYTNQGTGDFVVGADVDVLNTKIESVLTEKNTKILPSNIKKDVKVLGITGTYEGSGGGSISSNDVNFYDYDGTLLHSYSANEFAELTTMPENPTHQGLTAQGWNWSLADAKEYVAEYGMLDVGQMYVTDDGKTRIYITLEEGRLEPYLGFAIDGTATVDWGDGNTEQVTGTGTSKYTQHSYMQAGDYVISIESNSNIRFVGTTALSSTIITKNDTSINGSVNRVYNSAIKKIELGSNITQLNERAFNSCRNLKTITIPNNVTSLFNFVFYGMYSLLFLVLPNTITNIPAYALQYCYSLKKVLLPNGVTVIKNYALNYASSLESVKIPKSVTTIEERAFNSCNSLNSIIVPTEITTIGKYAISNTTITKVNIPNNLSTITEGAFSGNPSIAKMEIPKSVTSISASAFASNSGVFDYDFTKHISIPTLANTNAFKNIASDCQIIVPDALYEDWKVATNWSTYSSYIVKESEA